MPYSESFQPTAAPSSHRCKTNTFLALPLEIRNKIYKHLLGVSLPIYIFRDSPDTDDIESFTHDIPRRRRHWTALLYVNRQIYIEARAILYGGNQFELMEIDAKQPEVRFPSLLSSFLERIGPVNAGSLSSLCMTFPAIEEQIEYGMGGGQPKKRIKIREDGLQKLQLLRKECTGLRVIDMIYKGSGVIGTGAEATQEVLQEINTYLRAIPSLSRIVITVLDRTLRPPATVKDIMQQLGWIVLLDGR